MLKVLIVDDEKKICQLIMRLINWESMGFEVVGLANEGKTAFEFLQDNPVDVMITDIRMPGYDGMELIEKAKVLRPNIHLVIISGYSQFDYAQRAIKYGVEDYLLKPIRKRDLTATLNSILDKRRIEIDHKEEKEVLRKRITEDEKKVKHNLLRELLNHSEKVESEWTINQVNEEYYSNFVNESFQIIIFNPMLPFGEGNQESRAMLLDKTLQIVSQELEGYCKEHICKISNEKVYCILNGSEEELALVYKKMKKIKLDILRLQDVFSNVWVYIALSDCVSSFHEIYKALRQAKAALLNRFCNKKNIFLMENIKKENKVTLERIVDNSLKREFLSNIEVLDLEELGDSILKVKEKLVKIELTEGSIVLEVYKELINLFYFATHNYGISLQNKHVELMGVFEQYITIEDVFENLQKHMVDTLREWCEQKKLVESKPIRIAKQYIGEHYHLPITLEVVSKQIGFNPTYFSTMFKKETDKKFSEYLIEVRIENAKKLLLNTSDTVISISESVSYTDIKYFSKLFKKVTGLSPTEFRRLYN